MSWSIRENLKLALPEEHRPRVPHFSIDSTSHVQTGKKMEGLAWNYKDEWCLDSQVVFDELGLCSGFQLRPGNTKSGVGAGEIIRQALSTYSFSDEKWVSGDAAYCNQEVMTSSMRCGAKFTLTANQATTGWENLVGGITNWAPWQYSTSPKGGDLKKTRHVQTQRNRKAKKIPLRNPERVNAAYPRIWGFKMGWVTGVEPATPRVTVGKGDLERFRNATNQLRKSR